MPSSPGDRRNLWGCLAIATILVAFIIIYVLIGLNAKPANSVATKIQISPSRP